MNERNNPKLTGVSKMLCKNMTKEEKHLWYDFLKKLPQTVNRQKVIGCYVVDFYCAGSKLVVELDGSQHRRVQGQQEDWIRDEYLKEQGMTVLRYSNADVNNNFDGVCRDILRHMDTSSVSLREPPSPQGEG